MTCAAAEQLSVPSAVEFRIVFNLFWLWTRGSMATGNWKVKHHVATIDFVGKYCYPKMRRAAYCGMAARNEY